MKKFFAILALMSMLSFSSQAANLSQDEGRVSYKASSSIKGDLNDDGRVSVDDVTTLIDYLLKGTWPEDPYMTGYWLVMIHADGSEEYVPLHVNYDSSCSTTFNVIEPSFHNIGKFYYMIDGVKYYAIEDAYYNNDPEHYVPDMIEAYLDLGQPQYNPLTTDSSKPYFVKCGYSYVMGVLPFLNSDYEIEGFNAIVVRYAPAQP